MIWVNAPAIALRAGGTIAANRFCVAGASAGAVLQASTAGTVPYLGVSRTAAASGELVDIYTWITGVVEVEASAAISVYAKVTFTATGKAVTVSAATEMVCGLAMDASTADTQLIGVMLQAPNLFT
jgi:hypothetical protein